MNEETLRLLKTHRMHGVLQNLEHIQSNKNLEYAIEQIVKWEQADRSTRRHKATMRQTCLHKYGPFEPLACFDWTWPKKIDKALILEFFKFNFIKEGTNILFFGPSGVGKTNITKNIIDSAANSGKHAVFKESADLLDELLSQNSRLSIRQKIERYSKPEVLAIDEVGYLSYDSRHADVLFQLIQKRVNKSTIITTNRPFSQWTELFPNSSSVSALIDRLIENCEVVQIEADTYRGKKFSDRQAKKEQIKL